MNFHRFCTNYYLPLAWTNVLLLGRLCTWIFTGFSKTMFRILYYIWSKPYKPYVGCFLWCFDLDDRDDTEELDVAEEDFFFLLCFFLVVLETSADKGNSPNVWDPIGTSHSWEDHGLGGVELESLWLAPNDVLKSGPGLNLFIQLGGAPATPSQPMCATCFTSVGYPISISRSSFTTKIWVMNLNPLNPLQIPLILIVMVEIGSEMRKTPQRNCTDELLIEKQIEEKG